MSGTQPVAKLENLSVDYRGGDGWSRAVDDVSFEIAPGEALGLAGESGSGKTTVAYSLMGEQRGASRIGGGRVLFRGRDIFTMSEKDLLAVRGRAIGFVPQNPMASLTPSMKVGRQIGEMLRFHAMPTRQGAQMRVVELLDSVGIPGPAAAARRYPHELSGGQQQRVAVARAVVAEPALILADEPTGNLDSHHGAEVMAMLRGLNAEGTTIVMVTHSTTDAALAKRVISLLDGRVQDPAPVAEGDSDEVAEDNT